MLRRSLVGLLALGFSTGCATAQLERDIKVIRDELDSLRADYKRQSRDVEFLTARVLTMNAQKQQVAQQSVKSQESTWTTPARTRRPEQNPPAITPPTVSAQLQTKVEPEEPELPPIVLTMADLDNADSRRLPIHPVPAAPDFGLAAATVPETPESQRAFGQALDLYADGKLVEAIQSFRTYLVAYPSSQKRFDVYFWLGETLLELNQLDEAILSFQRVIQNPKLSTRVPDALYKVGLCHRRSKREETAQELFRRVVDDYPSSAVSSLARTQLTRGEL